MKKIMVSICCATYNHEDYISDAIESFLMQKTDFQYEILIHDDASTDRTADIIRKYEKKYPEIIKPIYQTENQYSKGIKVNKYNIERAKGKYIAICEGDDYWTDPYKLQKQVDYLENHPECSMCVHAAYRVSPSKRKLEKHVRPNKGNKIFTVEEVIEGGGGLFATNSIMYPRKFGLSLPAFYENAPVGDYPLAIYLALQGTVYYIDEYMSVYRVGVSGSWTSRMNQDKQKNLEHQELIIKMLKEIDEYSNYFYTSTINKLILKKQFELNVFKGDFDCIKKGKYKTIYNSLHIKDKTKILLKQYCPALVEVIRTARRKYRAWKLR